MGKINTSQDASQEAEIGADAADAIKRLAEIRAILDAFDWEHDDRQYALERIEMIVATEPPEE